MLLRACDSLLSCLLFRSGFLAGVLIWLSVLLLYRLLRFIYLRCIFSKRDFRDVTVLITGGAAGLGKLMAESLLQEGAEVVIWDINVSDMDKTAVEFREEFGEDVRFTSMLVDVSKANSVMEAAKELAERGLTPQILINNAGILAKRTMMDSDLGLIQKVIDVNLCAHFWTLKAFLPSMFEQNEGLIVSICSLAGLAGAPGLQMYCASKSAAFVLAESLRLQMRKEGRNIDVLTICPYYTTGPMVKGVKSPTVPLLEPEAVVRRTIEAMRYREVVVYMPTWIASLVFSLRLFFPAWAMDQIQNLLMVTQSMDDVLEMEKKKGE